MHSGYTGYTNEYSVTANEGYSWAAWKAPDFARIAEEAEKKDKLKKLIGHFYKRRDRKPAPVVKGVDKALPKRYHGRLSNLHY